MLRYITQFGIWRLYECCALVSFSQRDNRSQFIHAYLFVSPQTIFTVVSNDSRRAIGRAIQDCDLKTLSKIAVEARIKKACGALIDCRITTEDICRDNVNP